MNRQENRSIRTPLPPDFIPRLESFALLHVERVHFGSVHFNPILNLTPLIEFCLHHLAKVYDKEQLIQEVIDKVLGYQCNSGIFFKGFWTEPITANPLLGRHSRSVEHIPPPRYDVMFTSGIVLKAL